MVPANISGKAPTVLAALLVLSYVTSVISLTEDDLALHGGMCGWVQQSTSALEASLLAYQANNGDNQQADNENNPSGRRMMLAVNATAKTNGQKIASRVSLLSADAFGISYTAFKTARAAMLLLSGYLKASVTGTITIDNLALLDFAASVASLNAELSDLLSRISKLNADAINPLSLVKG